MSKTRAEYWDEPPETAREIYTEDRETFTANRKHSGSSPTDGKPQRTKSVGSGDE